MLKMFFSPQVKRSVIIITSKLAYKSCRVTKQLKTKGSRKLGNISEILKAHRNRPPPPPIPHPKRNSRQHRQKFPQEAETEPIPQFTISPKNEELAEIFCE